MSDTIIDLFEEKAQDFDTRDVPRAISEGVGACIREHVALDPSMNVMDFGAGTGLITRHIVGNVRSVTAVDVSAAMLEKLAAKEENQGRVTIVCQDILERPLERRFDLIVSAMAMHHVADTDALIGTFAAHLVPGGRVALADLDVEVGTFHPPDTVGVYHAGFERPALQALLEAHGFEGVRFFTALTAEKEGRRYPVFFVVATRR